MTSRYLDKQPHPLHPLYGNWTKQAISDTPESVSGHTRYRLPGVRDLGRELGSELSEISEARGAS